MFPLNLDVCDYGEELISGFLQSHQELLFAQIPSPPDRSRFPRFSAELQDEEKCKLIHADLAPPKSILFLVNPPKNRRESSATKIKRRSTDASRYRQKLHPSEAHSVFVGDHGRGTDGGDGDSGRYDVLLSASQSCRGIAVTADEFWSVFQGWAEDEKGSPHLRVTNGGLLIVILQHLHRLKEDGHIGDIALRKTFDMPQVGKRPPKSILVNSFNQRLVPRRSSLSLDCFYAKVDDALHVDSSSDAEAKDEGEAGEETNEEEEEEEEEEEDEKLFRDVAAEGGWSLDSAIVITVSERSPQSSSWFRKKDEEEVLENGLTSTSPRLEEDEKNKGAGTGEGGEIAEKGSEGSGGEEEGRRRSFVVENDGEKVESDEDVDSKEEEAEEEEDDKEESEAVIPPVRIIKKFVNPYSAGAASGVGSRKQSRLTSGSAPMPNIKESTEEKAEVDEVAIEVVIHLPDVDEVWDMLREELGQKMAEEMANKKDVWEEEEEGRYQQSPKSAENWEIRKAASPFSGVSMSLKPRVVLFQRSSASEGEEGESPIFDDADEEVEESMVELLQRMLLKLGVFREEEEKRSDNPDHDDATTLPNLPPSSPVALFIDSEEAYQRELVEEYLEEICIRLGITIETQLAAGFPVVNLVSERGAPLALDEGIANDAEEKRRRKAETDAGGGSLESVHNADEIGMSGTALDPVTDDRLPASFAFCTPPGSPSGRDAIPLLLNAKKEWRRAILERRPRERVVYVPEKRDQPRGLDLSEPPEITGLARRNHSSLGDEADARCLEEIRTMDYEAAGKGGGGRGRKGGKKVARSQSRSTGRSATSKKSAGSKSKSPAGRGKSLAGRGKSPAGRGKSSAGRSNSPASRGKINPADAFLVHFDAEFSAEYQRLMLERGYTTKEIVVPKLADVVVDPEKIGAAGRFGEESGDGGVGGSGNTKGKGKLNEGGQSSKMALRGSPSARGTRSAIRSGSQTKKEERGAKRDSPEMQFTGKKSKDRRVAGKLSSIRKNLFGGDFNENSNRRLNGDEDYDDDENGDVTDGDAIDGGVMDGEAVVGDVTTAGESGGQEMNEEKNKCFVGAVETACKKASKIDGKKKRKNAKPRNLNCNNNNISSSRSGGSRKSKRSGRNAGINDNTGNTIVHNNNSNHNRDDNNTVDNNNSVDNNSGVKNNSVKDGKEKISIKSEDDPPRRKFAFKPFTYEDVQNAIKRSTPKLHIGLKSGGEEGFDNAISDQEIFSYEGFDALKHVEDSTVGSEEAGAAGERGAEGAIDKEEAVIHGVMNKKTSTPFMGHMRLGVLYDHEEFGSLLREALSLGFLLTKETLVEMWQGESKPRVSSTTLTFHRPKHHCPLRRASEDIIKAL